MAKKYKLALVGHEVCNIHRRWNLVKVVKKWFPKKVIMIKPSRKEWLMKDLLKRR